jgi:hypothetical protein
MNTNLGQTKDAQMMWQGHTTNRQFGSDYMAKAQTNDATPIKH